MTADHIIAKLNLARHPEGGFYRETYRGEALVRRDNGKMRSTATAIYYLLQGHDKSHFHRIDADELWLFHQGDPLAIYFITPDGKWVERTLGSRLNEGEESQIAIKAHTWFAAQVKGGRGFALVSCVVAPGFDFDGFELADEGKLTALFPHLRDEINKSGLCIAGKK